MWRFSPRAVCPSDNPQNRCPNLVCGRDFHRYGCRLSRSTSVRRENKAHLFRGRREHPCSLRYLLCKDRRTRLAVPFRLRSSGGNQTLSQLVLDGANISQRDRIVRTPRRYFPVVAWIRGMGVATPSGVGGPLRSLGGLRAPPLEEGAGRLANRPRPRCTPSMNRLPA